MALCVSIFSMVFPICATASLFLFGPAGIVSALISVLLVAGKVSAAISMVFFGPKIQRAAFDRVLEREADVDLARRLDLYRKSHKTMPIARLLGKVPRKIIPFVVREVTFILLNFIPFVGTFLVVYLRAPRKGLRTHRRYFRLMQWQRFQAKEFYSAHKGDYTGYGIVAQLLEMIPALTLVFLFTGNVSMALWTADNHELFTQEAAECKAQYR